METSKVASELDGIGFFLLCLATSFGASSWELYYPLENGAGSLEEHMSQHSAWAAVCHGSDLPPGPAYGQAPALRNGTGGKLVLLSLWRFSGCLEAWLLLPGLLIRHVRQGWTLLPCGLRFLVFHLGKLARASSFLVSAVAEPESQTQAEQWTPAP